MAVPKKIAIPCFYASTSIFTGLSVYGAALYLGDVPTGESLTSTALFAVGVFGSLVGICYFGKEWDARKREDEKITSRSGKASEKKTGK